MKRKSAHARFRAWMHNVGNPLVREVCARFMRDLYERLCGPVDDARWAELRAQLEPHS